MTAIKNGAYTTVRVKAYEFDTKKFIGEYDSMAKAARKLFIRNGGAKIYQYLNENINTFNGILSYKTATKYHFEKA